MSRKNTLPYGPGGYDLFLSDKDDIKRLANIEMGIEKKWSPIDDLIIECILKNAYTFWGVNKRKRKVAKS